MRLLVSAFCLCTGTLAVVLRETQSPNPARLNQRNSTTLEESEPCGPDFGSCGGDSCCSQWGYCGTEDDYCGDGCQPDYGSCSGPSGDDGILGIPRPQFGNVPFGSSITSCSAPGTISITFDDGPYIYTDSLLDLLARLGARTTFFVNGNYMADTSRAPYPDILQRMINEGHQIGSHTWSHADLDSLDTAGRQQEMGGLENLFKDLFGYVPTYMRPPYGYCGGACQADLGDLGYHVIMWNIDTKDFEHDDPDGIQISGNTFDNAVSYDAAHSAYISLQHDVHQWTVQWLAEHIIQTAQNRGYRVVPVGECLGDPSENWYRDATTGQPISSDEEDGPVSPDGSCAYGSAESYTCAGSEFGDCCSQWGYCGSTEEYCDSGCQSTFGSCW